MRVTDVIPRESTALIVVIINHAETLKVSLGCKAIEVTLDTTDWRRVLKTLAEQLPPHVCVGVGTVMDDTVCCLEEIKQLGAWSAPPHPCTTPAPSPSC